MSGFYTDLLYAARLLKKSPGFTAVGVATLALGIGANTVIFTAVESFLLRPLPLKNPDRVVLVHQLQKKTGQPSGVAYPDYLEWKEAGVFESLGALQIDTFNLTGRGASQRIRGSRVTPEFFPVMGIPAEIGRTFASEEDRPNAPPVVVLSHSFWLKQLGGNKTVLGQALTLDGKPHTIIGVMAPNLRFPMGFAEFWVPMAASAAQHGRGDHFLGVLGRMSEGARIGEAQSRMEAIAKRLEIAYPDSNKGLGVRVTPLHEQITRGPKRGLYTLFGTVAFVLLICCANLANLMLARAMHRNREIAVRSAIGASRWRLLRQLLAESVLLSMLGGVAGMLLASWGVDALASRLPSQLLPMGGMTINLRVLIFSAGLSILTGILFGLTPALRLLRPDIIDALRDGGRSGSIGLGRSRTTSALIVGEIAISVVLLIGAGLLLNSLRRMQNANLGYDPRNVLTAEIAARGAKYGDPVKQALVVETILRRLSATPGVLVASAVNWPPMTNNGTRSFAITGRVDNSHDRPPVAGYRVATPRYADAMKMHLVRGRFISDADRSNTEPVVVVNERFAAANFAGQDALGQKIALHTGPATLGPWSTVIGIVADVRHDSPTADPNPEFYFPFAQHVENSLYLVLRTAVEPGAMARTLEAEVKSVDPDLPLNLVRPMEQVIADGLTPTRMLTMLFTLFSLIGLLLAAMGLYGVMSYLVARRIHEFGVRLALGATGADLLRLVLRKAMVLTGAGTLLGVVAGLGVSRVLASAFEGVRPEPTVFGTVAATLAAVAVLAAWVPLRRALAMGAIHALRDQ